MVDKNTKQHKFPNKENTINFNNSDTINNSDSHITHSSFLTADDLRFSKAVKKIEAIRPLIFLESRSLADIESISKDIGKSPRTIYRWIKKYKVYGSPEALLTPKSFGGQGKSRSDRKAEAVLQELIRSLFLSKQKLRISSFYREYRASCFKYGISDVPSYFTVYRRIKTQDDKLITRARLGLEAFKQKYNISSGSYIDNKFPLQTIMIDHTKLDIILLDDITNKEIGRPWLTIALDAYSRCIWGYHLGFQAPNADIVGLTIRMGALKKDVIISTFRLSEWPVCGIPFQIHTDNGKDFRSKLLERGCLSNGINLFRRPVKEPHYGSYIERFFGTLNTKLIHTLPGTTFSNTTQRGKYNSEKNAFLTINQLEKILLEFIVDQYHNEIHSALEMTPLEKWKQGLGVYGIIPNEPKNEERFRQDFLCFVEPDGTRVIERDGVHFKDLVYYAPELEILSKYELNKQKKYYIRFDPSDIRYIYVYDDNRNCYYKLFLKSRPQAPFSIYDLESTRKSNKVRGNTQANEYLIMETILRRREYIESIQASNKAGYKTGQRRSAAERRMQQLKNMPPHASPHQEGKAEIEIRGVEQPTVDVNTARIIRLDGGNL